MVPGLEPSDASERLTIFQAKFDDLWRKFITYSGMFRPCFTLTRHFRKKILSSVFERSYIGGEQLFGLSVTEYPELQQIKKELVLLQKLYGLYNAVIETVNGYFDILWSDIDIEKISAELQEFQNR